MEVLVALMVLSILVALLLPSLATAGLHTKNIQENQARLMDIQSAMEAAIAGEEYPSPHVEVEVRDGGDLEEVILKDKITGEELLYGTRPKEGFYTP